MATFSPYVTQIILCTSAAAFDENKTKGNSEYAFHLVPFLITLNVLLGLHLCHT